MTEPMPMPPPAEKPENNPALVVMPAKSKGEKLFDRITYAGIAGVGTFFTTVFLTHSLKYGRLKWVHEGVAKLIENAGHVIKPATDHSEFAEKAAMTTNLMMGGNVMLLPVAAMEHYKEPIVRGLNAAVNDPTPQEQIKKQPKQTFWSLLQSRCVAWIVVFASLMGVSGLYKKTLPMFENETGQLLYNAVTKKESRLPEAEMINTRSYRYGKIAALDIFATAAAATLLYIGGHFFARRQEEKKELRQERDEESKNPVSVRMLLRDGKAVDTSLADAIPGVTISGSKRHEGTTRDAVVAQQI